MEVESMRQQSVFLLGQYSSKLVEGLNELAWLWMSKWIKTALNPLIDVSGIARASTNLFHMKSILERCKYH